MKYNRLKTNIRICNVDGIRVYMLLSILHCFLIRIYHNCIWFRLYIRNVIEKNRAFLFMVSSMQNCKSANLHSCHNLQLPNLSMIPGVSQQPRPLKVQFIQRKSISLLSFTYFKFIFHKKSQKLKPNYLLLTILLMDTIKYKFSTIESHAHAQCYDIQPQ